MARIWQWVKNNEGIVTSKGPFSFHYSLRVRRCRRPAREGCSSSPLNACMLSVHDDRGSERLHQGYVCVEFPSVWWWQHLSISVCLFSTCSRAPAIVVDNLPSSQISSLPSPFLLLRDLSLSTLKPLINSCLPGLDVHISPHDFSPCPILINLLAPNKDSFWYFLGNLSCLVHIYVQSVKFIFSFSWTFPIFHI